MAPLPFKRTVKRKSVEKPAGDAQPPEQNAQDFFISDLHKTFFDKKTTEQTKTRKPNSRKSQEEHELADQPSSEARESPAAKRRASQQHDSKRLCVSLSSDEDDDTNRRRPTSRKSSSISTQSPTSTRRSVAVKSTLFSPSAKSRHSGSTSKLTASTQIISLDDSDSDDGAYRTPTKINKGKGKAISLESDDEDALPPGADLINVDDDDDDDPMEQDLPAEDDLTAKYVREAQERARLRNLERLAREAEPSSQEESSAFILIESRLEGLPNLRFKIQTTKKMQLVRDTWTAKLKQGLQEEGSTIRPSVLDSMFFTWKGNRIYDFTTLNSLGIKPVDDEGNLFSRSEYRKEGFAGWDKVHIEAWTPELYEQHQAAVELESKRRRGEIDDELEEEPEPAPKPEEKKIKVTLRSRNYGDQGLRVPVNCSVSFLIKAFRRVKTELPADKQIEIQFDGEQLEESSTIDEAGVEDMDVIEVHIR
ncbi:hypothetical protein JX265_005531 [Neoarthrinium moseri]|uniref:Ubiquitin-like domain-containing protein n=1 Tax=Neoarthrinium moseri TaxID=1658444 RepID=A0A9P9WNS8_9PEZI|nr:hypothetical protein JX265_005531 [Neoarthrinium moseri]